MENVLTIRWAKKDNPTRPTHISAHASRDDARTFVKQFRQDHPDMRPEISGGKDKNAIGAYRLPFNPDRKMALLETLKRNGSVLIEIDPQNPSTLLKEFHTLRGAFTRSAAVPIEVINMGGDTGKTPGPQSPVPLIGRAGTRANRPQKS